MNTPHPSDDSLLAAARERPAAERAAFLDGACLGDAAQRVRLEFLLVARSQADPVIAPPAASAAPTAHSQAKPEESAGDYIGHYKLLQKLGEGGCGTVYLAEQEEPVRRRVALKVIKLGMDTKEVIARFGAERQVLALMDHPNIAKVFDAGTTASGRPFFVMELVQGVPITTFCDEKKLPTAARLELFTQVCHAVQHAHQKGIIHRDIKPSNILVAIHDDVPAPKVIDFGIAKATGGRLTDQTLFTAVEQFMGTPAYMSPEQAQLSALDVDTRSDIYSLGVLLYELLTGRTPFDAAELLKVGVDEMRRHIREVDPPRPSTRLSTLQGEALNTAAQYRQISPPKLLSLIRGDLDWIVMRCLEKDRARRYETANSLVDDIRRHLASEPVSASPPSTAYRFQKLVRRNRLAFAAGTVVAVSLVLGVVVSTWQAARARRAEHLASTRHQTELAARRVAEEQTKLAERRLASEQSARVDAEQQRSRAQTEAEISKAVSDFLQDDLLRQADSRTQADAKTAPNPDLKVREALDRAGDKVGTRFNNQPLTEAAVRNAIGLAYYGVGDSAKAVQHLERALQLRKSVSGAEHPGTLAMMNGLANAYRSQGRYTEAAALYAQALEITKRLRGAEHPDLLDSMSGLATAYRFEGKIAEAVELHAQTLEIQKRLLGPEHPDTLASMSGLANAYRSQGKPAEAAELHAQALTIQKRLLGPEHPGTLATMSGLANALSSQGKPAEAAVLHTQTLEILQRVRGAEHPDTLMSMYNLAAAYWSQGKHPEAAALHAKTLAIQQRLLGPEHPGTLVSMHGLANAYASQGKPAEAAALHAQTLEIRKRVFGLEHPDTLTSMNGLANAYRAQGRTAEAAALYAETLEISERVKARSLPTHSGR